MRPPVVLVMSVASAAVLVIAARSSQFPAVPLGTKGAGVVVAPTLPQPVLPHPVVARAPRAHRRSSTPSTPNTPSVHRSAPAAPSPAAQPPRPAPTPTHTAASRPVTVNGGAADTPYGPVQVQISLRSGHIVASHAIDYPQQSQRDQEINSQAIPQLNDETVQADSAQIDTVSGATYTSEGYRQSLQSALDAAHRAGYR